ncbi:MAG: WbqC family protein [Nanoarchaeota archaeon]
MKVAIHQPNFLPYLGFFDKCDYADVVILYDSAQFSKNDFQNRNRLRKSVGWRWITIPVSYKFKDSIAKVRFASNRWQCEHLAIIEQNYNRATHYKKYISSLMRLYNASGDSLANFNMSLIKFFFDELGIKKKIILSSELGISSSSTQALVDMCKKVGATEYVSGVDGRNYLDLKLFKKENFKVAFQEYQHPIYNQCYSGFEPHMSILDLLFNKGPNSLNIIRSGRNYL